MRRMGVVVAALTLLGAPWATVSSGAATAMDVDCTSNVKSSFPPQLGSADQQSTIAVVDIYDPCTSTDSTLNSGKRHLEYSQMNSCNTKGTANPGTDDIVWNNGKVSTWEYTREVTEENGSATVHQRGKITAGEFTGDSAKEDLTIVLPGAYVVDGGVNDRGSDSCKVAEGQLDKSATGRLQISNP